MLCFCILTVNSSFVAYASLLPIINVLIMAEKRLINSIGTDPNQMLPIKYHWAREHYKNGMANNWVPEEISMIWDIAQWKWNDDLTENERHLIMWNLGFFSTAESLTANNIVLAIYKHVTNPEARQYLLRQAFEEAVHTDTFLYCSDSLGLSAEDVFEAYERIPSIKAKDDFVVDMTKTIFDDNFKTDTSENIQAFLLDLIGFYMIMEWLFFYAGFAMMLSLLKQNKMVGMGEQFQYILRDESTHIAFGADLINGIIEENPEVWTTEFQAKIIELFEQAVHHEINYVEDCLPFWVLGLNGDAVKDYVKFIADRRLEMMNLPKLYNLDNPFPWMSEMTDLRKEKNFFETKVTEYQSAGQLEW